MDIFFEDIVERIVAEQEEEITRASDKHEWSVPSSGSSDADGRKIHEME
ncbi:hypothetical protein SAMN05421837_1031020 [Amycolatopsis pretoriensis]|uniref:Uncharacterized protein n=1 Tax=Amycolatopsis pretoriensis TaxID=218821 RepID=A0A1H5QNV5_9PSEU|nr:hypothetical protein [Amycolatopsis pretoriensis]SEF27749.1 hypothetical protein SAMN05421837_1031020 [Amycolatopsis pretoriensis]